MNRVETHLDLRSGASRLIALLCLLLLPACGAPGSFAQDELTVRVSDSGVAVGGFDVISYLSDDPQLGASEWRAQHGGATYWFASRENRDRFQEDPQRYLPAFGGWCAWAVADGEGSLVAVDPKSYLVQDGRLLLFYDGWLGDTRELWRAGDGARLLGAADTNWARMTTGR